MRALKFVIALIVAVLSGIPPINAQVSINKDGSKPDSSAMLDVASSVKGILLPRTVPGSIPSPATGLIIYHPSTNRLTYYNGTTWVEVIAVVTSQAGAPGSQTVTGYAIKPDASAPHHSSLLDVSATDKGLLIPRMTDAQRDQLFPVPGLAVYNTSSNAIEYFNGTAWYQMNMGFSCGQLFTDSRDSKVYSTVQIGTQCWMAESLNFGSMIPDSTAMSDNSIAEKYCYENDALNCLEWGALYQWDEAMQYTTTQGAQGLCFAGWHIPSETEWVTLENFLGGKNVAGGKMKEAGTTHWVAPNSGATNSSGFTAIPAGYIYYLDPTPGSGLWTHHYIWASTESSTTEARRRGLFYFSAQSYPYFDLKTLGLSVRCVRD